MKGSSTNILRQASGGNIRASLNNMQPASGGGPLSRGGDSTSNRRGASLRQNAQNILNN